MILEQKLHIFAIVYLKTICKGSMDLVSKAGWIYDAIKLIYVNEAMLSSESLAN